MIPPVKTNTTNNNHHSDCDLIRDGEATKKRHLHFCCFLWGKRHDNKIWKVQVSLSDMLLSLRWLLFSASSGSKIKFANGRGSADAVFLGDIGSNIGTGCKALWQ